MKSLCQETCFTIFFVDFLYNNIQEICNKIISSKFKNKKLDKDEFIWEDKLILIFIKFSL
jgi:hypothetical protein